jgi:formimidoylglutamate deiminase
METVFAKQALLPDGWADNVRLQIEHGRIQDLQSNAQRAGDDTQVGFIVPGLCNAHSHAFQRALAGHTEQRSPQGTDTFWTWREKMYALAGVVDAAALSAIARQAYCEMLVSGYTAVVEFHYLHRDSTHPEVVDSMFAAISEAAADSGIRLTYVPVHYERAGFDEQQPTSRQRGFAMSIDEFLRHHERVTKNKLAASKVGIGAHSLRAVSPSSLHDIAAVAAHSAIPMHLHVAEQQLEVEQCLAAYGRRPVRWLLENFDVSDNWCLVHATHMDMEEIEALAGTRAVVGLCPSTEANLGDGLFPLREYLHHGGRLAIGSDSHISINPFEELRWLEYGQRLKDQTRNIVSLRNSHVGSELFLRALEGGAQAGGLASSELVQGAAADFVALSDDDPMFVGHDSTSRLDALVFSGYPLPVERVMVDGKWCVVDATHIMRDSARNQFKAAVERLGQPK